MTDSEFANWENFYRSCSRTGLANLLKGDKATVEQAKQVIRDKLTQISLIELELQRRGSVVKAANDAARCHALDPKEVQQLYRQITDDIREQSERGFLTMQMEYRRRLAEPELEGLVDY